MEILRTYIVINGDERPFLYELEDGKWLIHHRGGGFLLPEKIVAIDPERAKQLIEKTREKVGL